MLVSDTPVEGASAGGVLVARRRGIGDPDHAGSHAVTVRERVPESIVWLRPDTAADGDAQIVAVLVEVPPT